MKPRIFTPVIEDTGVGFYRIVQPTKHLTDTKQCYVMSSPFTGEMTMEDVEGGLLEQGSKWADIVYMNTAKTLQQYTMVMALRDWSKVKLVIDADDDFINLNYDHPSYRFYNDPNLKISEWAQRSIMYADLVIVSTSYLKQFYSSLCGNIYINPNTIDFDIWKYPKKKYKKLRIGWAGAQGHFKNLEMIEKPVREICDKYDCKFVTLGGTPRGFRADKSYEFVPLKDYPKKYAEIGFDIALAPLLDTRYNRAKSNLRLIETGAMKIPIVASPVGPYKNFPCLYAKTKEDWYKQLERFVKNTKLRKEYGEKAWKEVKTKYNIKVVTPPLLRVMKNLTRRKWQDRKPLDLQFSEKLK